MLPYPRTLSGPPRAAEGLHADADHDVPELADEEVAPRAMGTLRSSSQLLEIQH